MITTIELLKHQDRTQGEYAARFLRNTGDWRRLQALLAGRIPASEVHRLALYERELRLRITQPPA